MSRVGKKVILIPEKVKISQIGNKVSVEGKNGRLSIEIPQGLSVSVEGNNVSVSRASDDNRELAAKHGLMRAQLFNMVLGVDKGFTKELEITGVGYRAELKGDEITLVVGYSHPVVYKLPDGVKAVVEKQTKVILTSADKQLLGQVTAQIAMVKPPEPYKAKGIKIVGQFVRRKAGKTAASGGKK